MSFDDQSSNLGFIEIAILHNLNILYKTHDGDQHKIMEEFNKKFIDIKPVYLSIKNKTALYSLISKGFIGKGYDHIYLTAEGYGFKRLYFLYWFKKAVSPFIVSIITSLTVSVMLNK
ncbi:hypothetical protein [Phascolarctobacterium sp.]